MVIVYAAGFFPYGVFPRAESKPILKFQKHMSMHMASKTAISAFNILNKIRTQPLLVESKINNQISLFSSDERTMHNTNGMISYTKEGVSAWKEAYKSLGSQPKLSKLEWSDELALAAYDLCD